MTLTILVCGGRTFGHIVAQWKYSSDPDEIDLYHTRKKEYEFIFNQLYRITEKYDPKYNKDMLPDVELVHGTAKGADTASEDWAIVNYTKITPFKPDINTHGSPVAFFMRNEAMAEYVHNKALKGDKVVFVAFPGGTGTDDMFRRIERVNKRLDNRIIVEDLRKSYYGT